MLPETLQTTAVTIPAGLHLLDQSDRHSGGRNIANAREYPAAASPTLRTPKPESFRFLDHDLRTELHNIDTLLARR